VTSGTSSTTVVDSGGQLRPWQWSDFSVFVKSNLFLVPLKIYYISFVSCACELTTLFSVVFQLVRAAHKFDFGLVIGWAPNKWRPVYSDNCSDRDFLTGSECFLRKVSPEIRDLTHAIKVRAVLVSWDQYIFLFTELRTQISAPLSKLLHLKSLPTGKSHTQCASRGQMLNPGFESEDFFHSWFT
jgi:hypothetical protein